MSRESTQLSFGQYSEQFQHPGVQLAVYYDFLSKETKGEKILPGNCLSLKEAELLTEGECRSIDHLTNSVLAGHLTFKEAAKCCSLFEVKNSDDSFFLELALVKILVGIIALANEVNKKLRENFIRFEDILNSIGSTGIINWIEYPNEELISILSLHPQRGQTTNIRINFYATSTLISNKTFTFREYLQIIKFLGSSNKKERTLCEEILITLMKRLSFGAGAISFTELLTVLPISVPLDSKLKEFILSLDKLHATGFEVNKEATQEPYKQILPPAPQKSLQCLRYEKVRIGIREGQFTLEKALLLTPGECEQVGLNPTSTQKFDRMYSKISQFFADQKIKEDVDLVKNLVKSLTGEQTRLINHLVASDPFQENLMTHIKALKITVSQFLALIKTYGSSKDPFVMQLEKMSSPEQNMNAWRGAFLKICRCKYLTSEKLKELQKKPGCRFTELETQLYTILRENPIISKENSLCIELIDGDQKVTIASPSSSSSSSYVSAHNNAISIFSGNSSSSSSQHHSVTSYDNPPTMNPSVTQNGAINDDQDQDEDVSSTP